MENLEALMQSIAAESRESPSLSLAIPRKIKSETVVGWVGTYFQENPEHTLELHIHRANPRSPTTVVRVTQDSFSSAFGPEALSGVIASIGSSGQNTLPGQARFFPMKYRCPICGRESIGIPVDAEEAPLCHNDHPPRRMILE